MNLCKTSLTHDAASHHTSCDRDTTAILWSSLFMDIVALFVFTNDWKVNEIVAYVFAPCVYRVFGCRIWVNTHVT